MYLADLVEVQFLTVGNANKKKIKKNKKKIELRGCPRSSNS